MSRRKTAVVILCEDLQHSAFVRKLLLALRFQRNKIRVMKSPKGRGAGEQYVSESYPIEVQAHRSKATHQTLCLLVVIDADTETVKHRSDSLDRKLAEAGMPSRAENERIALMIPRRNIETWIHYLKGDPTNETTVYPKLKFQSECKAEAERLAEMFQTNIPHDAPPSLVAACRELTRCSA